MPVSLTRSWPGPPAMEERKISSPEQHSWTQEDVTATKKIIRKYKKVNHSPAARAARRQLQLQHLTPSQQPERARKRKLVRFADDPEVIEAKRAKTGITICPNKPCKIHANKMDEAEKLRSILKKKMDLQETPRRRTKSVHNMDDELNSHLEKLALEEN